MNERLKLLRKSLHLSQEEFGKNLGVTKTAISKLEKGENKLTRQMVLSICRTYKTNENWLLNGTGDIFKESDDIFSNTNYKDMIIGAVTVMNIKQQEMLWVYIKDNFSKEIGNE